MPRRKKTVTKSNGELPNGQDKAYYLVKSMEYDDGAKPLKSKRRFGTEEEAIAFCKELINQRGRQDQPPITLCVLKVCAMIRFVPTPPEVLKLR